MAKESGVSIAQSPKTELPTVPISEKEVQIEEDDDIKVHSEKALFVPHGDKRRLTI